MRYKMPKVGLLAGVLVAPLVGVLVVLAAMQFYYVQEMLAALLLFSMGFAVVTAMISILFLLDRGLYRALAWTGPCTAHAAQRLHREWVQVEQFGRKHFHHSEQSVER
jgi:hypothetical protein